MPFKFIRFWLFLSYLITTCCTYQSRCSTAQTTEVKRLFFGIFSNSDRQKVISQFHCNEYLRGFLLHLNWRLSVFFKESNCIVNAPHCSKWQSTMLQEGDKNRIKLSLFAPSWLKMYSTINWLALILKHKKFSNLVLSKSLSVAYLGLLNCGCWQ